MFTAEQRSEFETRGMVRLRGVFSRDEAAAMEERVWAALGRKHGVCRENPASWKLPPGTGLQSLRTHAVFRPNGGPALLGALDALIGEGRWEEPKHWGQFLVSFPAGEGADRMRTIWHTDFPYYLPVDRLVGALVFSFMAEVPPQTGGTLVMAGSHRLVARFVAAKPHLRKLKMKITRRALMSSEPWLTALSSEIEDEVRVAMTGEHNVGGIPAEVVELTGEPGDVVVAHPWMLHTPVPNRGDRPRFMRVQRVTAAA
jgi:hypothetical protein